MPDDWQEQLFELAEHQEKCQEMEGKQRYLQGKLRRLRDLYVEGDFGKAEYDRRKTDLQARLDVLQVPERPDVEQAGETLETLGQE